MIVGDEGAQVGLVSPNAVASDVPACKRHTMLGPEALSQVRLPTCEGAFGLTSSAHISGATSAGAKPLGLVRVAAASTREALTALIQRLPDQPTTAGLVTETKKFAALAK